MRGGLAILLVLMSVTLVGADDWQRHRRGDPRTDLFVDVPLDHDTGVVFPFGGSHHAVPGVVTINQAPYYCRPHKLPFQERARFIEHLAVEHGLSDREIPALLLVEHNQVRYVGD